MVLTHPISRGQGAGQRRAFSVATGTTGLGLILLGAWAAIVPFVGPTFGFSADGTGSWTWGLSHALLFLVPGAAAVIGGLLVMTGIPATVRAGGMLAALAGAWLIIGPVAWPVLEGSSFFSGASALGELSYWIGYSLGPGALLIGFGAFVTGFSMVGMHPAPGPAVREAPPEAGYRSERLAS